ncbi:hypothetical protein [Pseudarthrobacter sp. C4D7]|uniref:hypothetical protein n=1 Tax=Pseudarthrobacter sp. C4D7 TaxID=2735268 RepID=UPI00158581D2|nr:hypothetical protein [Pseudarthrobacter sp. C4D7]
MIAELFVFGAVVIGIAVKLFRHGSTQYSSKVPFMAALFTKGVTRTGYSAHITANDQPHH